MRDYLINAYDLEKATGIPYARPITGRGLGWSWKGTEFWGDDRWEAMAAHAGIERWVTPGAIGSWWPAEIIEKAAELGLHRKGGRKLTWREGRPCEETISGNWTSHRCERPAVAVLDQHAGPLPVCSMHNNAAQKRAASTAAMRERFAADRARRARAREHGQLAEELLEWARPLLGELGIHPATITVGSIGERTGILLPAEAVATLIQEATGERYPGRPDA